MDGLREELLTFIFHPQNIAHFFQQKYIIPIPMSLSQIALYHFMRDFMGKRHSQLLNIQLRSTLKWWLTDNIFQNLFMRKLNTQKPQKSFKI